MAAKTSASSAFNSYFYQQQQQHASKQMDSTASAAMAASNAAISNDLLSDLHFKMLKKIAQLTKVVYSLNSKNDESEYMIATLKAQYDEEKEQFINETNKRLDEYREKLAKSNDQSKRIAVLENALDQYESHKEKALKELEEFKKKSTQNEETLLENHKRELQQMNDKLAELKRQQDDQSSKYEQLLSGQESDKHSVIEELKTKHRAELERLKETLTSSKDTHQADKKKLAEKYDAEIEKLKGELALLGGKLVSEKTDYEQNVQKLKAFHEKELEACKQNSNHEYLKLIDNLKSEIDSLDKQKSFNENELNIRNNKTLEQLIDKEKEIETLTIALNEHKANANAHLLQLDNLNNEILELKNLKVQLDNKLSEFEAENNIYKEKQEAQSKQIIAKSNAISRLEASNLQSTSTISDLKQELQLVRERLDNIEKEKAALESENQTLNGRSSEQLKTLKSQIASLNEEKCLIERDYKQKVESLNDSNAKLIDKLNADFGIQKQEIVNSYENRLNVEKATYEEKMLTLERDLCKSYNAQISQLHVERNEFKTQLDTLSDQHKALLKNYQTESKNLDELYRKTVDQLNSLQIEFDQLRKSKTKLDIDYSSTRETCEAQKVRIDELTNELEQLKVLFESTNRDSKLELKVKLEKLNKELESKWTEKLRIETEKAVAEMLTVKEEEKRLELENLNALKDEEIRNLKSVWQAKTNELLDEISALKKQLNEKELKSKELIERTKASLELENRDLLDKLNKLSVDYQLKLDKLQSEQSQETKIYIENIVKQNELKITELKNRHLEDLKAQAIAQKAALSTLKQSLENSKSLEIELVNEANNKKLELVKYEMEQKYYNDMDNLKHDNEMEILTVRAELEKVIEIGKQKERETEIKLEEFQSEIRHKQKQIDKFINEINELKLHNSTLKEEIDLKSRELKQIRADTLNEIKNKEAIYQQKKEEEIVRISAESHKQKQILINEFRQAQELLKQKIIENENELRQMHDRFLNRESRPEDLELIQVLRRNLAERDELIKKIQDEKRYFQMELVNRENNFNKMFNASPNVGTINPLNANTKIKSKANSTSTGKLQQQSSVTNLTSPGARLEPIPGVGSPLHDLNLNPNKPLPKKFLS